MIRKFEPGLVYAAVALAILGPLLLPGYILTLDMVFTPELRLPDTATNNYLFQVVLHGLGLILPSELIQKILLLAIFWLAGQGMHRLATYYGLTTLPALTAGLLYMVNPFTYDRFVTGQYLVLFGYALLPWLVRALLVFAARPDLKRSLVLTAWVVGISIVNIHSIGPMLILGGLVIAVRLWQIRYDRQGQWWLVRWVSVAAGTWLVASSYWLVPALLGRSPTAEAVGSFTGSDRLAFATLGGSALERLGNVLSLQGFWAEDRGLFRMPQEVVPGWALLMLLLISLVIGGAMVAWRRQPGIAVVFAGSIVIGAVLAAGIGGSWLAAHLPFYAGYREPQKFAMLVALGYAFFAAYSASALMEKLAKRGQGSVIFVALPCLSLLGLVLVITPVMLWGTNGQLRAADYPSGWYAANQRLNTDPNDFQTLFLPWHLYLHADFAGRIIANPAGNFFDKPVVVGDDAGLKGVALSQPDPVKRQVGRLLATVPSSDSQLGEKLAGLQIKYILVAETSDYLRYGYLDRQINLQRIGDYEGMRLYLNQAYRSID